MILQSQNGQIIIKILLKKYKENLVVVKLLFEVLQSVKIQLKNPMPEIIKVF